MHNNDSVGVRQSDLGARLIARRRKAQAVPVSSPVSSPVSGSAPAPAPAAPAAPAPVDGQRPALGTIAKFVTPPLSAERLAARSEATVNRFMFQSAARELMPAERVACCLRVPHSGPGGSVQLLYSAAVRAAHFGGLQTCGSVWMCPVCSSKVSERRRVELSAALDAATGPVLMATFTIRHRASNSLSTLLGGFLETLRRIRMGKPWERFVARHGLSGSIRALEVTHGSNGWHPHAHVLFFFDGSVSRSAFETDLRSRWLSVLARAGLDASWEHGVDVAPTDHAVSNYVSKFGQEWTAAHELTKATVKLSRSDVGRSPSQLLADYILLADSAAGVCWREYATHFKGKKQLVWSEGLRSRLLPELEEKTDEALAAEQAEDATLLALLSYQQWRLVLANDARGELLNVASSGDVDEVFKFLARLGAAGGEL